MPVFKSSGIVNSDNANETSKYSQNYKKSYNVKKFFSNYDIYKQESF